MAKNTLTLEEVTSFLTTLPYADFKEIVKKYSEHTKSSFDKEMDDSD